MENSRFWLICWILAEVVAVREASKSFFRVSRADCWVGEARRSGSIVEGAGGSNAGGARRGIVSEDWRRRVSQVWRSDWSLE